MTNQPSTRMAWQAAARGLATRPGKSIDRLRLAHRQHGEGMTRKTEKDKGTEDDGSVRRKTWFGPMDQPNLESDHVYPATGRFTGVRYERKKGTKPVPQKRKTAVTVF